MEGNNSSKRAAVGANSSTKEKKRKPRETLDDYRLQHSQPGNWDFMFKRLEEYKRRHGDVRVPLNYMDDEVLARWVADQRKGMRSLRPYQKKRLDSLGFVWNELNKRWDDMFDKVVEYKKMYGHCAVPTTSKEYPELAMWVRAQRRQLRVRKKLDPDRKRRLDSIGFCWDASKLASVHDNDSRQKAMGVKKAPPKCTRKPRSTPNQPSTQDQQWEKMFRRLQRYQKANGHCLIPVDYPMDQSLSYWVYNQRHWRNRLDQHRIDRLDSVGFCWTVVAGATDDKESNKSKAVAKKNHPQAGGLVEDIIVGTRLAVLWPKDRRFHNGIVTRVQKGKSSVCVQYDQDASSEWIDPQRRKVRLLSGTVNRAEEDEQKAEDESVDGHEAVISTREAPHKKLDGTFSRPRGRAPNGESWDYSRGMYVPTKKTSEDSNKQDPDHRPRRLFTRKRCLLNEDEEDEARSEQEGDKGEAKLEHSAPNDEPVGEDEAEDETKPTSFSSPVNPNKRRRVSITESDHDGSTESGPRIELRNAKEGQDESKRLSSSLRDTLRSSIKSVSPSVKKYFHGLGWCEGEVTDCEKGCYRVMYENGTRAVYNSRDLSKYMVTPALCKVETGSRVAVCRPFYGTFQEATVIHAWGEHREPFCLKYEDGSTEWVDLRKKKHRLLTSRPSSIILGSAEDANKATTNLKSMKSLIDQHPC